MRNRDDRPGTLVAAFVLWLVLAGLLLVTSVTDYTASVPSSGAPSSTSGGSLLFGALVLVFALRMHARRNWARIALTVCGALVALPVVNIHVVDLPGWAAAIIIGVALIGIAGIVLLYVPASNEFFRSSGRGGQMGDHGTG
jgi:hypothetical protein